MKIYQSPTALAVPLTISQILAANKLKIILGDRTDVALYSLADRFPDFDIESVLLKVAAINQLYSTNVWAVTRMAQHVVKVMSSEDATRRDYSLVEILAHLPKSEEKHINRDHVSFAAKFAHFFIDRAEFPIYDTYAVMMVKYHLGRASCLKDNDHPYRAFQMNFNKLRDAANLKCTTREIDSYLWLAGLHRKWKAKADKSKINKSVYTLYANAKSTAKIEMAKMCPE